MKILQLQDEPIEYFPYQVIQAGGRNEYGNRVVEEKRLPILLGKFTGLGADIDALIATSDLQGNIEEGGETFLLGEKLPAFLSMLLELEFPDLDRDRIGVLLCGDFYANLEKRGGLGDVKQVWRAFKQHFKWVVGIAGNHDDFGDKAELDAFKREKGIHLLHGQIKKIDGLDLGGIGGIIGPTDKSQRLSELDFLTMLKKLLLQHPDLLLLHQGPDVPTGALAGHAGIRATIESSAPNTIFCGHEHWDRPLAQLKNGSAVLNLDGRVVLLIGE
jgi:Icc-related predicted phosphoesterase